MISSLLGDALDDVEAVSGERCDGFSSSVFNCIITMASGVALCIFNYGITYLGYQAPTAEVIPMQNTGVQKLYDLLCDRGSGGCLSGYYGTAGVFKNQERSASKTLRNLFSGFCGTQ